MEIIKNFVIGVFVLVFSLLVVGAVILFWPILAGITSFIFSLFVGVLFLIVIFYAIALVGFLVRKAFNKA